MNEAQPVIKVRNLTCGYDDTVVVDDVSFDVMPGEVFIILGGSGCGKSTLLKNMIGLYEPMAGQVFSTTTNSQRTGRPTGPDHPKIRRNVPDGRSLRFHVAPPERHAAA